LDCSSADNTTVDALSWAAPITGKCYPMEYDEIFVKTNQYNIILITDVLPEQ
jgi:hypothetical protein